MSRVITFGTFDVFHIGHLRLLERAAGYGDNLIVGISTDNLNFSKKGRRPIYSQHDRMEIVKALRMVDTVFFEDSLDLKKSYIEEYQADTLVMGDDWKGRFDWCSDACEVVYLERTPSISTTEIIEIAKLR